MVDHNLILYIEESLKQGKTRLEIEQTLLANGWSQESITSSFTSLERKPPTSTELIQKLTHNKFFIIGGSVLVVIILIFVGYVLSLILDKPSNPKALNQASSNNESQRVSNKIETVNLCPEQAIEVARQAKIIPIEEAKKQATDFVNKNLVQGTIASISSMEDFNDCLYRLDVEIGGTSITSYMTKDGKNFFPQAMDIDIFSSSMEPTEIWENTTPE